MFHISMCYGTSRPIKRELTIYGTSKPRGVEKNAIAFLDRSRNSWPSMASLGDVELIKMQKLWWSKNKNKNENQSQNEIKNENSFLFSFSFLFTFCFSVLFLFSFSFLFSLLFCFLFLYYFSSFYFKFLLWHLFATVMV